MSCSSSGEVDLLPVTESRYRGKDSKESSKENHFFLVCELFCQGHDDQGDAREKVTDVEKEKTSE